MKNPAYRVARGSELGYLKVNFDEESAMVTINAKELRRTLPSVVRRVRGGSRFLVLYRSRPAFEIQPVSAVPSETGEVEADSLFDAPAVGSSQDGLAAADHDNLLYQA